MNQPLMPEWRALHSFNPKVYQQNLQLLSSKHPHLLHKLETVCQNNQLQIRQTEQVFFHIKEEEPNSSHLLFEMIAHQNERVRIETAIKNLYPQPQSFLFFILGLDLGYTLQTMHSLIAKSPLSAFIVVEPIERMAAASFFVTDLSPYLNSNRVEFVIGQDFESQLEQLFFQKNYFAAIEMKVLPSSSANHPEYAPYWNQLRQSVKVLQTKYKNQYQSELRDVVNYYAKKPFQPIQSMMSLVQTQGKAVRFIQQRFLDECKNNGIEILEYQPGFANEVGIMRAIHQQKPDCLLFINRSPGEYVDSNILNSIRLPRMVWCVDDPNSFMKDPFTRSDIVFSWDHSYKNDMIKQGAVQVDHFPYVADLDQAKPNIRNEFISPVSYIGQVKAFDPVEMGFDEKTTALVQKVADEKFRFPEQTYQSLILKHQSFYGLRLIETENDAVPRFVRYGIYTIANALRRIAVLEAAMPYGLKLYGGEDWLHVLKDHPLRNCYQGAADPLLDVPDIFVSSSINLNIHSLQALTSLNQRDFNCPLVGGFLLTDWVENADQFFKPNIEMVFYNTIDELKQKIKYYLHHPDERSRLIEKGRDRVLKEHTYSARVPGVLKTLNQRVKDQLY